MCLKLNIHLVLELSDLYIIRRVSENVYRVEIILNFIFLSIVYQLYEKKIGSMHCHKINQYGLSIQENIRLAISKVAFCLYYIEYIFVFNSLKKCIYTSNK